MVGKKFLISLCLVAIFAGATQANKSVFIISKHGTPDRAQAYSIEGDEVVYQDEVDISGYNEGYGAVAKAERRLIMKTKIRISQEILTFLHLRASHSSL